MKISHICLLLLIISPLSFAKSGAEKEAEILFNTLGMDTALEQTIIQMVDLQLQQNPAMAPYKHVMIKFFNKHMNYESLKPELVNIYIDVFSEKELKELNSFYATDTGKKTIEKMPELMAKGGQIGMQRVQNNIQEFETMIAEESKKIQDLQSK
tara:strand:+ start:74 stop:535 length:462 start_codon:yes stop_codon:yes gene_type:complete